MEKRKKYPRTFHLPYSPTSTSDDKRMSTDEHFKGKLVVVTIKMDGENTTIYKNTSHARSLNSVVDSEDRNWIEAFRNTIRDCLSDNMRICGENMFYKHTCVYNNLKSMYYAHSIWNGSTCLSWKDTVAIAKLFEISMSDIIYIGPYSKTKILNNYEKYKKTSEDDVEGFVVRLYDSFTYDDFSYSVNKYVDESFQVPDTHWRHAEKVKNKLKSGANPWSTLYGE